MATSNHLPMLKECCCGCTLKTGTMIIGFLSLLVAVIASCITFVSLTKLQKTKHVGTLDIALQMLIITVRILQIGLSLLLIVGSHKGRASYVCPWLVLSFFMVLIESFYLSLMACELVVGTLNGQIFSLGTHISVTIYFMLVVFSYYREIQQRKTAQLDLNKQKDVRYDRKNSQVINI